ncbi:MAG: YeeE/YedE family protein [Flavobacterium sp.]|nr:YeeE/YedE family protein [Flavobacterium sp.]
MDFIFHTWHWSISGFLIAIIMLTLNYFGKVFGMSSNLRSLCSIAGADKCADFFKFDWKSQRWNLAVVAGAMIGGFVAVNYMSDPTNVNIDNRTKLELSKMKIDLPNGKIVPNKLFGIEAFKSPKIIFILITGGFLIGFGSRYAGGCTSGHAISGLSNFQRQSLKAVIGFFVGGLIMAHFILPLIFRS